jgi:hypothetical protein
MLSTWGLPGYPLKIIKFQACLQDPQKSEKVTPRSPKGVKMTPEIIPPDINLLNKWKKRNHSKTAVFIMVIAHAATGF